MEVTGNAEAVQRQQVEQRQHRSSFERQAELRGLG